MHASIYNKSFSLCFVTKNESAARVGTTLSIPTLESDIFPYSQYGEFMRAANQFYTKGGMAAETYAAELDRIIAAGISGANDKDVWIEEFDDE